MEEKPDNRPLLPPNYVSLRQLRERRLKEEQEKDKDMEKVRESNGRAPLPPNYVPLRPLKEWCPQEEKEIEIEKGRGREEEADHCARLPPNFDSLRQLKEEQEKKKGKGMEEESETHPLLPPNYVSLRKLREQRIREQKERENENENEKEKKEERMKRKMKEKEKEEEEGGNCSLLPPDDFSLWQIKELRLQEKKETEAEVEAQKPRLQRTKARDKRDEAQKPRLQRTKAQEKGHEAQQTEVEINKKSSNRARNLQSKKPDKLGGVKSGLVWQPVLPPADTSTNTGISSANSALKPENSGVSHEVVMALSHQNRDTEMKPKNNSNWEKKNSKRKDSRKATSGKNKGELLEGHALPMEVTCLKGGGISSTKEVSLSQNENDTVKKGKEEKVNLTKSSGQCIPVCLETKVSNGARSMRFRKHNRSAKDRGKEVNLLEPNHNVVPVSKVAKGSDGLEEVIGSKIKYPEEQKGKGEMVDISQSSDQTPSHEDAKGVHGAGEVIGSQSGEENGRGKNGNVPESSKWGDQVDRSWMSRNRAAGIRRRDQWKTERFTVRPSKHFGREGGKIWVPKKSS